MEKIKQLQQMIDQSERIVFFGGAGVSTESGIPDFRSVDGLYHMQYEEKPETILSRSYFDLHPDKFFRFYRNKTLFPNAMPNAAHLFLTKLEKAGKLSAVVTQNIDGLHQKAGTENVLELHGSTLRNYCMNCKKSYPLEAILTDEAVPHCACGGIINPDVVLYEEPLHQGTIRRAVNAISAADLLIIGGTSLVVYPAAGLIDYFAGKHLVLINKSPTTRDELADLCITEPIGEVFSKLTV